MFTVYGTGTGADEWDELTWNNTIDSPMRALGDMVPRLICKRAPVFAWGPFWCLVTQLYESWFSGKLGCRVSSLHISPGIMADIFIA